MIYIIDKENQFHIAEYFGRSFRYFTKCGQIINKSERVMTLNFGDLIRYMCPLCKNFSEFVGKESLCYDLKNRTYDTGSRLMEIMKWHEKGYSFIKPEFIYAETIERMDSSTRLKQRFGTRKYRKYNVY